MTTWYLCREKEDTAAGEKEENKDDICTIAVFLHNLTE